MLMWIIMANIPECPSYLDWLEDRARNPYRKPEDASDITKDK